MPRGQSPLWRRTKGRQWSKAKQPFRLSAFPTLSYSFLLFSTLSYSFLLFPTLECLSCRLVQKRIKEAIWLNCDLYHQAGGQSSYMDVSTLVKFYASSISKFTKFDHQLLLTTVWSWADLLPASFVKIVQWNQIRLFPGKTMEIESNWEVQFLPATWQHT